MKVMVGMPCYGNQMYASVGKQVMELSHYWRDRGIGFSFEMVVNQPYVETARNILVEHFLGSDCTHLLFLDSDVMFIPEQAQSLLEADRDVVCGIYPRKQIRWDVVAKQVERGLPWEMLNHVASEPMVFPIDKTIRDANPLEVTGAATGFMMIKREVFEGMSPQEYETDGRKYRWWFRLGTKEGKLLGEDIYFCQEVRRAGFRIWVLPKVSLGHIGYHVHQGCLWCENGAMIHGKPVKSS